jgi:hypothetical protein
VLLLHNLAWSRHVIDSLDTVLTGGFLETGGRLKHFASGSKSQERGFCFTQMSDKASLGLAELFDKVGKGAGGLIRSPGGSLSVSHRWRSNDLKLARSLRSRCGSERLTTCRTSGQMSPGFLLLRNHEGMEAILSHGQLRIWAGWHILRARGDQSHLRRRFHSACLFSTLRRNLPYWGVHGRFRGRGPLFDWLLPVVIL